MSDPSDAPASGPLVLPDEPSLEWLRKRAKQRLAALRASRPDAKLADAQLALAREVGFPSWRALKAHVDARTREGALVAAARAGDLARVTATLDDEPALLHLRTKPYGWTLLHVAAHEGRLTVVDALLRRGIDPDVKEQGDETCPMHWAAAAGHVDVVRRLADAGGDVVGHGDDHGLEVIGWATCWDGCDDDAHRTIVALLLERGARHHIFSAIAMNLGDEVRRLVREDPSQLVRPMSRNENHRLPIHHAVRMNRPDMLALLLTLGADPAAVDGDGGTLAGYAAQHARDRRVLEILAREGGSMALFYQLALGDEQAAARVLAAHDGRIPNGILHLAAKRGDAPAVAWLLARGADPNARWAHWDADVTPLHLAIMAGDAAVARALLASGADPAIRDSRHDGDALGWAEHFGRVDIVALLRARAAPGAR